MLRSLVGSEMCIRDRYQRRVRDPLPHTMAGMDKSDNQPTNPVHEDQDEPLTESEMATIQGRKIFVGGLSWDTDDQALKAHFEQFGHVDESVVVYNKTAGISRGFGFITYKEPSSAQAALQHPESHRVNDKTIEAKLAVQKGDQVTLSLEEKMAKQVFVGGLPPNVTSDNLKEWAEKWWGTEQVVNAIVVLNMETKLTRGFGFVNFRDPAHVEAALKGDRSMYVIDGKQVEVKRAQTQDKRRVSRGRFNSSRGRGKGGRGRGRNQQRNMDDQSGYGSMSGMPSNMYSQGYNPQYYEHGYLQQYPQQGQYMQPGEYDNTGNSMMPPPWMMPHYDQYMQGPQQFIPSHSSHGGGMPHQGHQGYAVNAVQSGMQQQGNLQQMPYDQQAGGNIQMGYQTSFNQTQQSQDTCLLYTSPSPRDS
eukprot:TRINITY_DN1821_c0_g2_i6.p1 TRINITY_DN1821_c0_g2~~TRINITY_DN1821_c0_g2_i6.p1  ORF type:complete len:436 (-),score=119.09 TRINITY_DN1821_c0_g2_i6:61-1314(-)